MADEPADSLPPGGSGAGLRCLACRAAMGAADTCPVCGWTYASDPDAPTDPDRPDPAAEPPSAPERTPSADLGPPPPTGRAAWAEVSAVLAVGVIPHLTGLMVLFYNPGPPPPYWVDAVQLTVSSGCVAYVTLYLMHRSGEPWARFGLDRPRALDLPLGVGMLLVALGVLVHQARLGLLSDSGPDVFRPPRLAVDYLLMAVTQAANGFAEELVTRAYLITRLERLLRSAGKALLLSALAFASYHAYQGAAGFLYDFLFGLAYGGVFLGVRRVWPLALGHALYNVLVQLLW